VVGATITALQIKVIMIVQDNKNIIQNENKTKYYKEAYFELETASICEKAMNVIKWIFHFKKYI
jgi:hypothetical protein